MSDSRLILPRRQFLSAAALGTSGLILSGCDRLNESEGFRSALRGAEKLNRASQRLIAGRDALAREFGDADISRPFKSNGNTNPDSSDYVAHLGTGFANWRLVVDGLVAQPLALSLAQIMAMPAREQITRHDCVEGWSAIGKWRGPLLGTILKAAGLSNRARYVVFHCADRFGDTPYYESIDLIDAFHPQTILAWGMNGQRLPVAHGAPLRLRVERQLGYKHAKYVMRIEAVSSLADIGKGKGGFWEDSGDYEWYAGI